MIDILLLAGAALCVLSVLLAIIAVMQMQPPRGAAITLMAGLVLLIGSAWLDDRPFGIQTLRDSGQRLLDGEITFAPAAEAGTQTQ